MKSKVATTEKSSKDQGVRILGRMLAEELTLEQLKSVGGGAAEEAATNTDTGYSCDK